MTHRLASGDERSIVAAGRHRVETSRWNLLLLLPLALPFLCLAAVSLVGFLGVLAIGGALQVVASIKSGLGDCRSPGDVMEGGA